MQENCFNHPDRKALSFCRSCGKYFCEECLIEGVEYFYCKEHAYQYTIKNENGRFISGSILKKDENTIINREDFFKGYKEEIRKIIQKSFRRLKNHTQSEKALQVRPWVRYWARTVDYLLFALFGGIIIVIIFPKSIEWPEILFGIVLSFFWISVEASFLSSRGTTPGKWLLNIELRDSDGRIPTFNNAYKRSFLVWWRGMGAGIPIVTFFTVLWAHTDLKKNGITTWDHDIGFVVKHKKIGPIRIIVTILFFIVFFMLYIVAENWNN